MMPVLFIGHGSPMNAVEANNFNREWRRIGKTLPKPEAVLCVSAHWITDGYRVSHNAEPRTIHDFYGFPESLNNIQYPAPGHPELAERITNIVTEYQVRTTDQWGLDHGAWSVLMHLFPDADVPVVQFSLNQTGTLKSYTVIGQELARLRSENVLILGSGNVVHNLRQMSQNMAMVADWANRAQVKIRRCIEEFDKKELVRLIQVDDDLQQGNPTIDHIIPILPVLGAMSRHDEVEIFNDRVINNSISMLSFIAR